MDKLQQLIVRACKSKDPETRLKSLYRRFYMANPDDPVMHHAMMNLLSAICGDYLDIRLGTIFDDLHPGNRWRFGINENDSYWQSVVKVLTSYIRGAHRDKFPGLTPPAMFRIKKLALAEPLVVTDEDEIWNLYGALEQYKEDCAYKSIKRPSFIDTRIEEIDSRIQLGDKFEVKGLLDDLFEQRTQYGEFELENRHNIGLLLAALYYTKHQSGFHGADWVYKPNLSLIRELIAKLELKLKDPE